jgi:hypothetical protein
LGDKDSKADNIEQISTKKAADQAIISPDLENGLIKNFCAISFWIAIFSVWGLAVLISFRHDSSNNV